MRAAPPISGERGFFSHFKTLFSTKWILSISFQNHLFVSGPPTIFAWRNVSVTMMFIMHLNRVMNDEPYIQAVA